MTQPRPLPRVALSLTTVTSRHASLRTWRAQCRLGKNVTHLSLAVANVSKSGAAVSGSFWASRESTPIPLVSSLLAAFSDDPTGLKLDVWVADTMPFTGELAGRFLSLRDDAVAPTAPFAPSPAGDWWLANCALPQAAFLLGINDLECKAILVPRDWQSAKTLAAGFLGLWVRKGESWSGDGAA